MCVVSIHLAHYLYVKIRHDTAIAHLFNVHTHSKIAFFVNIFITAAYFKKYELPLPKNSQLFSNIEPDPLVIRS